MEEKKLESYSIGEIIKALYICTTADDDMDCSDDCPMYEEDYCTTKLLKMAFDLIQRLRKENARLKYALLEAKNNMLAYGSACVKEGYEKAQEQIEQLMKENEGQRKIIEYQDSVEDKNAELQKQVDELKEERENMQAEIMRFEDMKFTQEHCNLYEENEWLKASLQQVEKDTAQKILGELDLFFKGTTFRKGYEFKKIDEKLKELAKRHGVEV